MLLCVVRPDHDTAQDYIPFFFFQAEDGIRDFCLSRGLGDVYKRQVSAHAASHPHMGVNALDAVQLTFAGINALRQHVKLSLIHI
ncbi:hypothetical protein CDFC105_93902 [Clostridioides difficile]|nr:hypothetical protein CDFC105_93902 [Clostridioides difficile]